jgi:glycosyltransferase involved in cell wall biosynthesis
MRILFLTSKLNYKTAGGSVPDLDLKVKDLMALGHDVSVITAFSKGNILDPKPPYPVFEERVSTKSLFSTQPEICRLLRRYEEKADVFHVEGQFMYGAGAYRRLGGKVPVVSFFNRELISWPYEPYITQTFKSRCRYLLEKWIGTRIANGIDAFIFTSPPLKAAYRAFGLREKPTLVMPDFVNSPEIWRIAGAAPRADAHGEPRDIFTLMSTGRMIPEKGFDDILRAFSLLEHKERFRLVLGGNGPEEMKLRELSATLGINPYVTFTGWIEKDEMLRRLAKADAFILPKWRIELTSVILIEAMALAIPSIVMAGGGLEWLAGDAGVTIPEGDTKALAARIEQIAADPALRMKLAENGLKRLKEFDHESMAKKMEELFKAQIAGRSSS